MKVVKSDVETRARIAEMSPYVAKSYAKRVPLRPDWNNVKLDVMRFAIDMKFNFGTKEAGILANDTDANIVEYNTWHDNYWGVCMCHRVNGGHGMRHTCTFGNNHLGKILMARRSVLREKLACDK
jgi:predicted NAD-dependent protein-ADP-ribosyltransferase YbiA (DUF1768 family)